MSTRIFWFGVLACLATVGCGENGDSPAHPIDGGSDATADAKLPPPVEAGTRVRTVETRNPFGETAEHNLMVDGDFELTSASGQFGWQATSNSSAIALIRETGGLCRSGLTCARIGPEITLIGFAAAPRNKPIEVSLWSKPPTPDCELTVVNLINCTSVFPSTLAVVPATTSEPDASGWCHHYATAPATDYRPCLFVSSFVEPGTSTLIDQASILPADGSGSSSLGSGPPSADMQARAERALRIAHERMRFGRTEPSRP